MAMARGASLTVNVFAIRSSTATICRDSRGQDDSWPLDVVVTKSPLLGA